MHALRIRQHEVEQQLAGHTNADEIFHYTLSILLELVSKAHTCFVKASIEQKRKLLTMIFANLEMDGTTLWYTLRKPFDVLAELPQTEEWYALQDSNL